MTASLATATETLPARRAALPQGATVALLMALSGFAGLAYQIVWTQQLGTWLGHEIVSVLAVVAAFFGGLALGALLLGRRIARSTRPGRWYAALELAIALWALALLALLPAAGAALTQAIGTEPGALRHWGLAFAGPFLLLLPATAAMGATLPALQRVLGRLRGEGYALGGLYACNTLGAALGALAAAFLLAPALGLNATVAVAAGANLLCAALAWRWLGAVPATPDPPRRAVPRTALWALGLGGLLGIGYEVLVVRVLSQVAENTVYTYALLLAIYLLGSAAGAALYQRRLAAAPDTAAWRGRLAACTSVSALAGVLALAAAAPIKAAALALLGPGYGAALGAEATVALLAFALPTLAMGALFSHLCVEAREADWRFGDALAANTLGATLAAPLFGVALLPWVGAQPLLVLLALAYLLLLPRPAWRGAAAWLPAAGGAALLLAGPPLRFVDLPEGGRLLSHRDGVMASVSVVADADGTRRLHVNNREQEGSSATRLADARQAALPLLLHPAPKSALFLGLGTGVTARAAAAEPGLKVEAVELLPEVVEAARWFAAADAASGAARIVTADARRHVRASTARHDVIVADLFHPARSGSGALYTVEHFAAVRERLAPGGLFCQWLPLHQLDLGSLRSIVAAYLAVYPEAVAVLATHSLDTPVLGLVAWADGAAPSRSALDARLAAAQRGGAYDGLQLDDGLAVPGSVIADSAALRRLAGDAMANRDDRPQVAYRAPRLTYAPDSTPRERLLTLLQSRDAHPAAVFGPPAEAADADWQRRVAAYWQARDRYLEAGMAVRPASDLRAMLAQVQAPLLEVLRLSPEFRPAYDPLLRMAVALGRDDPVAARALLAALQQRQPARPEAAEALRRLGTPP